MKMRRGVFGFVAVAGLMGAMLLGGCKHRQPSASDLFNDEAKIGAGLPYPVMEWRALTTSVDRGGMTTSTLFGNDVAVTAARGGVANYPAGAVLGLVTWRQQEDAHWFGGRIPDAPVSVEFVEFGGGSVPVYRHFAGAPLSEQADSGSPVRLAAIESMKPVVLP
jgi:hypothetical protein